MGSALAPVVCTLMTSRTEFLWLRNFRKLLLNIGLLSTAVRCADNGAFHFHKGLRRNLWTQLLLNLEFYGSPILLEYVRKEKFLGTISPPVNQRTVVCCVHSNSWAVEIMIFQAFQQGFGRLSGLPDRYD